MGTGLERESLRPLVLRHAYQTETRRYTPRCPAWTLLYRIVAENLETVLQAAREPNESGLGLPKYVGGALVFQHRFGGSLNLNTHLHAVLVDGVFEKEVASDGTERVQFHALPPQHPAELTAVAYDVYRKFEMWLKKKGPMRLADADETYDDEDALASCLRGSVGVGQVVELGEAGDVRYSQELADEHRFALRKSPHTGEFGGFSIHAGVTVHAADKDGRERLIRYCARPALSMERMSETSGGLIAYRLRHAPKGGATHRVMRPIDLLARIAALIPPPRHPLLRYFGVVGPHSSWRKPCVPTVDDSKQTEPTTTSPSQAPVWEITRTNANMAKPAPSLQLAATGSGAEVVESTRQRPDPQEPEASPKLAAGIALNPWRIDWATLLKRTYDFDVLSCPCGGRLKAVELVTEAERARELLEQFGMSAKPPPIARARSPDWD